MTDVTKTAHDSIEAVFGDTSVSLETTLERLDNLRDLITERMECVQDDLKLRQDESGGA